MRPHGPANMHRLTPLFLAVVLAGMGGRPALADPPAPGEPPITTPGEEGEYVRKVHWLIHYRWATQFVEGVLQKRPPNDPLRRAQDVDLLFAIRWDGSPADITVSESSGVPEFDRAAVAAVRGGVLPYPVPPAELYGDDGVTHFRWTFPRGPRLCSGGELRRVEAPLADALPRLFYQGRIKEALMRVARYTRAATRTPCPPSRAPGCSGRSRTPRWTCARRRRWDAPATAARSSV